MKLLPSTIAPHGASSTGLGNWYATALFWKPQVARFCCQWDHDDYSLNVANLPMAAPEKRMEKRFKKRFKKRLRSRPFNRPNAQSTFW